MRVNPAVFLEKQGDIREKRRKFDLNLKKQTQFMKGLNKRKVNYDKGIREIYAIGHLDKINPIQSQTKPICQPSAGNPKFEFRNPTTPLAWPDACCPVPVGKRVERVHLKKQSQFICIECS